MPPRTSMPEMLVSHTMKSHGKQQAQRNPAQHRYKCYRQGTVSSTVWTSAATGAVPSAAAFCTDRGLRMHPSALRSGNPESPGIPTSRHNMLPGFISLLLPGLRGSLSLSLMLRIETKYTKELPAQLHGLPLGRVGSCAPVGNEGAEVFRAHVDFQLRSLANTIKLRNTCTP